MHGEEKTKGVGGDGTNPPLIVEIYVINAIFLLIRLGYTSPSKFHKNIRYQSRVEIPKTNQMANHSTTPVIVLSFVF